MRDRHDHRPLVPVPNVPSPQDLPPTMVDEARETELRERGWTVVPLLSEHEVDRLRGFYRQRAYGGGLNDEGAYDDTYAEFTVIHSKPEFREAAYHEIIDVVGRRAAPLLDSYRPLVANFVNKPPGTGVVPIHQNWSVVDEARFRSVSVWVALTDVTPSNGALELLPGSHRAFREPRGMWAYEAFTQLAEEIHPRLEPVPVRAGEAIVLDDAVIHYSAQNRADSDRLAIQLIMVPEQAEARFYRRPPAPSPPDQVQVWSVTEGFFWDFWHGDGDERFGSVVDHISLDSQGMDGGTFRARLAGAGAK